MTKKILLGLGTLTSIAAPIATVVACGDTTTNVTSTLNHQYVLKNSKFSGEDTSAVKSRYYSWGQAEFVDVIDKIDSISAPSVIAVDQVGDSIIENIKLVKNMHSVFFKGSDLVSITFDDAGWSIDANGNIKTLVASGTTQMHITVGTVTKDIKVVQRAQIINQKIGKLSEIPTTSTVSYPSVWGTTTTTSFGTFTPTGTDKVLKVSMNDVHEAAGATKAYGYITNMHTIADPIEFDSTINYVGIKLFIPQNMVNTVYWFRSYYDGGQNIDFTDQSFVPDHAGWYTFSKAIDHSKFTSPTTKLAKIKLVQMVGDHDALSGDIYIEGIYVSDKEIGQL